MPEKRNTMEIPTPAQEAVELPLEFDLSQLEGVLNEEPFSPEKLIALLETALPDVFKKDAGVWEKYTIEQHTLMVIGQFEKYFAGKTLPAGLDVALMRLILALHEVGKPKAIVNGGKQFQHLYTPVMIKNLLTRLGVDNKKIQIAVALTSGDPMGKYIKGMIDVKQAREEIEKLAGDIGMPVENFFEILSVYYKVDAGSYTKDAGGLESLDFLFVFDTENGELNFAPDVQAKIDLLGVSLKH